MAYEIKVERRDDAGKGASRRLRHAGMVPAIVYGGGRDPVAIQLSHDQVWLAQQHDWFYSSILDLNLGGNVQQVLLRDLQRHPSRARILHLDFQRVTSGEAIRISVPLNFVNGEDSPAGKAAGVVIMHELTEVEIACLPKYLPGNIEVDLSKLEEGDVIRLSEIALPEGVEIPALALGPDQDVAVVVARQVRGGGTASEEEGEDAAEDAEGEPDADAES